MPCCAPLSHAATACWGRWQAYRAFSGVELRKGRRYNDPKWRCRVGRAVTRSRPLARSGRADFPHTALPPRCLAATFRTTTSWSPGTCLTTSRRCTWVPPEAHLDTGRLGAVGSRGFLFPDVIARMPPSDSLPPSATAPVPLAGGLPRGGRLFCALRADDTCARSRAVRRRRVTGSPPNRHVVEERRGPPR
jgi:hypothetical protein